VRGRANEEKGDDGNNCTNGGGKKVMNMGKVKGDRVNEKIRGVDHTKYYRNQEKSQGSHRSGKKKWES